MPTPDQSQATRPISFVYQNKTDGDGVIKEMRLNIRPEELTRTDTSRLTVHHTLGGAFADNFGPGIPTVQIAGHTGWGQANNKDGLAYFQDLYKFVYRQWHDGREKAVQQGLDPNQVKLIFCDQLDSFTWLVAPASFVLKRNRSNPLLSYYQITLTWLADDVVERLDNTGLPGKLGQALKSFEAALDRIDKFASGLAGDINEFFGPIHEGIGGLMNLTARVNRGVLSLINSGNTVINAVGGNLIGIASGLSLATSNLLAAIANTANIPQALMAKAQLVKLSFLNLFCLLENVIKPEKSLPPYNPYGSSLCSSTAGGAPLSPYHASANSFEQILGANGQTVGLSVSAQAENGIAQLAALDTLSRTLPPVYLNSVAKGIIGGVR